MKALKILFGAATAFFALTVVIYWFNLDTKAVKLIEKPMMMSEMAATPNTRMVLTVGPKSSMSSQAMHAPM